MAVNRKWVWATLAGVLVLLAIFEFFDSFYAPLVGTIGDKVHHFLHLPIVMVGQVPITTIFVMKVAIFLICLGFLANAVLRLLQKRVLIHTPLQAPQQYAVAKVISYLIFIFGLAVGLESLGLNLSSLVVVGGALGLGVGLGLQPVVANFVAGLILLFEQPIRIGDRIQVGDTFGDVIDIRGRSTWVRTNDNIVIIVPNSDFITNRLTNWTVNDRQVRISVPIGVGYGSNPDEVRGELLAMAKAHSAVLEDPAPDVVFQALGDNSLNFELRVWTKTMLHAPTVLKSDLYFAIFRNFSEKGIEMPFPQRDLHLRSVDAVVVEQLQKLREGGAG